MTLTLNDRAAVEEAKRIQRELGVTYHEEPGQQQQILFWNDKKPTREERMWWINKSNPEFPLGKFIGNGRAIKRLSRVAFSAFGRNNHSCASHSFAFVGPASTGKTTLAKLFADTVRLPLVEVESETLSKLEDSRKNHEGLLDKIKSVCAKTNVVGGETLALVRQPDKSYLLPPIIIFIDEVHNLKKNIVQGLLKAVEGSDCRMVTECGTVVDTRNVCWIVATTELGDLFGPFVTRFTEIRLRLYSRREIARIVNLAHPELTKEVCMVVANYSGLVPRESIDFANEMKSEYEMNPGDWNEVAQTVAEDRGIDNLGMTYQRLNVLEALGQGPITINQLMLAAQCQEAELRKYVLPPLLATTPDQPEPLITIGHRYTIMPAGIEELNMRGIANLGESAIPERYRK